MAAPTKSKRSDENDVDGTSNKISTQGRDDEKLQEFLKWNATNNFNLSSKVIVSKSGSCSRYGLLAVDKIENGECLFEIPRRLLLHAETSSISKLLSDEAEDLESDSGWIPVLVALMYEYNNPQSLWRPYLDLVPDFKELNLPMFWSNEERECLLKGTGIVEAVTRDEKLLANDFNTIVLPFIEKHADMFPPVCKSIEFYKKMVAFVMAYSFTESNQDESIEKPATPMMVPTADILNSIAKNNAHLEFHSDVLKMVAIKDISKGQEVFNSYGEPANAHLLQMYGYAEEYPNNHNDTAEITVETISKAALELTSNTEKLLKEKFGVLQDMCIIDEDESIVIGQEGVLTEDECQQMLRVIYMSEAEYSEYVEKEGWSDEEADEEKEKTNVFSFDNIPSISPDWKKLLLRSAEMSLERYRTTLEEDQRKTADDIKSLPTHHRYSFYTAYGQKMLLKNLIDACNK